MDLIESSLCRLRENVGRFVVPSTALRDAPALKAQIELRQRALTDIEIIRWRLRPFMHCAGPRLHQTGAERRKTARSRVGYARQRCS
jgi:hypothetical protein